MSTNPSVKTAPVAWRLSQDLLSVPEITLVLFGSTLSLYLLLLPDVAYQPWDSLDYAYSTETLGIITMRGNHPLGHVIHYLIYALARAFSYEGRALLIAQIVNAFAGSLTVAVFFWLLAGSLKIKPLIALGCSIILGTSYGFWFFTNTADIYTISLLCILLTWSFLVHEVTLRNHSLPIAPGIFAGISIVAHQLNILLIPTGMFLILLTSGKLVTLERKTKQLIAYILYAALTFVAGYIFLGFIATSSYSLSRVIGWARGYFGDPTYGHYLNREYFHAAMGTASQTILANTEFTRYVPYSILIMALGLILYRSLEENKRSVLFVSFVQTIITWVLVFWWEPQTMKFWILSIVPWMVSLAFSFEAIVSCLQDNRLGLHPSLTLIPQAFPLLIGILVLAANFPVISNQHNPQSGTALTFHRAMNLWVQHSEPDSVLLTAGDLVPHLLYWGDRPGTIILYRSLQLSKSSPDGFSDLRTKIDQALCKRQTVLIAPEAIETITDNELSLVGVSRTRLRVFFNEYITQGKIAFWYENIFNGKRVPVYELTSAGKCNN